MMDVPATVLVVEDDPLFRGVIKTQVAEIFPNATVTAVATVDDAFKALSSGAVDLCLLDLFLGDRSGFEVLDFIGEESASTAVIVLTAHSRRDLVAETIERGAIDFIIKGRYDSFTLEKTAIFALYRKRREAEIALLARRDPLTRIANRAAFTDHLEHALKRSERTGNRLGVLFIDIDGFKPVNDTHGHAAGDELLIAFADRLSRSIRRSDVCARLGGDEFAVILESPADGATVLRIAEMLMKALSAPYTIGAGVISVGASVGAACVPEDGTDVATITAKADERMYEVKRHRAGGR